MIKKTNKAGTLFGYDWLKIIFTRVFWEISDNLDKTD